MNILITGGCGFLGRYLTKDLLEKYPKANIRILDIVKGDLPTFMHDRRVYICSGKNICSFNSIKDCFEGIDVVFHLAASLSFFQKDKRKLEKINIAGTRNVLRAALHSGVGKFIHISSVASLGYNDREDLPIDETYKFDWGIARKKRKYYMLTKHLGELEVKKYVKKGLTGSIVYPGLMFGPGDITNSPKFIEAIQKGKMPFNMPGGTNVIDARDVSRGLIAVLEKGKSGENYLLSGHNLTMKEINETIARSLGVSPPKYTLPMFFNNLLFYSSFILETLVGEKLGVAADNVDSSFKFRYFNNSKAGRELGWQPEISFDQTVRDTIEWLRNKKKLNSL